MRFVLKYNLDLFYAFHAYFRISKCHFFFDLILMQCGKKKKNQIKESKIKNACLSTCIKYYEKCITQHISNKIITFFFTLFDKIGKKKKKKNNNTNNKIIAKSMTFFLVTVAN